VYRRQRQKCIRDRFRKL